MTHISINHPFYWLNNAVKNIESDAILHFSCYKYTPKTLIDDRKIFSVEVKSLNLKLITNYITELKKDEELAFQSNVEFPNGSICHFMLVDFSRKEIVGAYGQVLNNKYNEVFEGFTFYDSGRSVHGYSATLVSEKEWHKFMGTLLLVNDTRSPQFVDSRWIGHRLIAGYGALRWSANTAQYLKMPNLIPSKAKDNGKAL